MKYLFLPVTFLTILSCNNSPKQTSSHNGVNLQQHYQLTRDTHHIFPSRMHITGKITELVQETFYGTCSSLHMKIDLDREPGGYPRSFAYVAVPCAPARQDIIAGRSVSLEVFKVSSDDTSCALKSTKIKTFGITPWYKIPGVILTGNDTLRSR